MKYRVIWFATLLLILPSTVGDAAAPTSGGNWQVVLAAGDDQEPVFDDATRALARRLQDAGVPVTNIHRLSASPREIRSGVEPATAANLLRIIGQLPVKVGGRCFVFLTSHGQYDEGLWLARSQRALHPEELAKALSRGCAVVPTVVVVSACYSGGFAAGTMREPNRIIMTASRRDRPSFGCQVERAYSFFDGCFLRALPQASTWEAVFRSARSCVSGEEKARGELPSDPQAYFGPAAAGLSARFGAASAPQRVTTIGATPSRRVTWSATSRS